MTQQDNMMRVIDIRAGETGPNALYLSAQPIPQPQPEEVLIAVHTAGVNRPDLLQRQGKYPAPPGASPILGLEVAGTIAAIGSAVERWQVGDAVCALIPGGGYADYAVAHAGSVLPLPKTLDMTQAAGLPETIFTVWANVFERGGLKPGETFLIHGANSGIGVTAIQMAKAHGARVIATARGIESCAAVQNLGPDLVLDTTAVDFCTAVQGAGGADVILDMVGGSYVQKNIDCLNLDGRLVQIAFMTGSEVTVDLRRVMLKRLTITGSTLRARPAVEKARLALAIENTVWPWIAAGQVKPMIDRIFPLEHAAQAHAHLERGGHMGKIILQLR